MVHTNSSDEYLGSVISHNNKPIALLSTRLRNQKHDYTTTKEELSVIV